MRAKAWWALAVVLGGCGGSLEHDAIPLHAESLGTIRQAEAPGGPVAWVRSARGEGLQLGSAVTQGRVGNVLLAEGESSQGGGVALDAQGDAYFCGTAPGESSEDPSTGTRTGLRRLGSQTGAVVWTQELEDGDCSGIAVHGNAW